MRTLILYSSYLGTKRASYYNDWLDAFRNCKYFDITAHNIVPPFLKVSNPSKFQLPKGSNYRIKPSLYRIIYQSYTICYRPLLRFLIKSKIFRDFSELKDYDLIVLLHSTNADSVLPLFLIEGYLKDRRGKLLIFVGNEYCLMPEKIRFIQNVEADYIATQLPRKAATWLYSDCIKSRVLLVPQALNDKHYKPRVPNANRKTDIGFIGDEYSFAIGDIERTALIKYFAANDLMAGLEIDIRFGRKLRLPREQYVKFLNSIRGTIGAESGTYYLEKTDKTLKEVEAFLSWKQSATFDEVYDLFFKNYSNPVNGKAISSRHFEAAGTKTCQILLEGYYNGILQPDIHYIPVKKDHSNISEVLEKFRDKSFAENMTNQAYADMVENHTHQHRVLNIWKEVS